jgi:carboxylate-amine ligase
MTEPSFTVGIEEEYLLVDKVTRDLVHDAPDYVMAECERRLEGRVTPEFLQSQIEVGTSKCPDIKAAAAEIFHLRKTVAEVAGEHGLAPIAASTHPFAAWDVQKHTDKERYNVLARDMQAVARRLLICGMHVHVGLDDDALRLDLMGQIAYFLPHLLALSTSSPFWRGEQTGLKSYRLAVFDELPRTGLPESFDSWGEYQRHLDIMVGAGLVEDASKLWWDVRPSARFPTLEVRIPDVCTRAEDGITIAAIYICLLRMLYRLKRNNQRWRQYTNMLVQENRWRAQRYGFRGARLRRRGQARPRHRQARHQRPPPDPGLRGGPRGGRRQAGSPPGRGRLPDRGDPGGDPVRSRKGLRGRAARRERREMTVRHELKQGRSAVLAGFRATLANCYKYRLRLSHFA